MVPGARSPPRCPGHDRPAARARLGAADARVSLSAIPDEPGRDERDDDDGPVRVVETIWRPGLSRAAYEQLLRLIFEPVMDELAARRAANEDGS